MSKAIKKRIITSDDEDDENSPRPPTKTHRLDDDTSSSRIIVAKNRTSVHEEIDRRKSMSLSNRRETTAFNDPLNFLVGRIKQDVLGHSRSGLAAALKDLRSQSLKMLGGHENFFSISSNQLSQLFHLIDLKLFFGCLSKILQSEGRKVSFRVSSRMTSRAGQVLTVRNQPKLHELTVSSHLILQAFSSTSSVVNRAITANGVQCYSRIDCLLSIVEHEMIHLLLCCTSVCSKFTSSAMSSTTPIGCVPGETYHGSTFQTAALVLCGHTDWTHDFVTVDEIAYDAHGINVGTKVEFSYLGEKYTGKVNRVQKRVTVLVSEKNSKTPHAEAREFSDGKFYRKFYIPVRDCRALN